MIASKRTIKKGRGFQTVSDENSHKRGTALSLFCDEKWNISATDQKGFEMPHTFFSFLAIFADLKV